MAAISLRLCVLIKKEIDVEQLSNSLSFGLKILGFERRLNGQSMPNFEIREAILKVRPVCCVGGLKLKNYFNQVTTV